MDPLTWALLGLMGAWAALDGVSAGQFMVSRPLVTATLTGWLLGDPTTGFILGLFLEVLHLAGLPVGAVQLPEPGPAAIPATVGAMILGGGEGLALGAALGVALAVVGGWTVVFQRRWQGRLVHGISGVEVVPDEVGRRLALALALDGFRGLVLTWAGIALAVRLGPVLQGAWPLGPRETVALLVILSAFSAGTLLSNLPTRRRRAPLLLLGLGGGILLSLLLDSGATP
jgi:hypothetical protein